MMSSLDFQGLSQHTWDAIIKTSKINQISLNYKLESAWDCVPCFKKGGEGFIKAVVKIFRKMIKRVIYQLVESVFAAGNLRFPTPQFLARTEKRQG